MSFKVTEEEAVRRGWIKALEPKPVEPVPFQPHLHTHQHHGERQPISSGLGLGHIVAAFVGLMIGLVLGFGLAP